MTDAPKIKKVNAYPFAVQMKTSSAVIAGRVQKITLGGFLAEIPSTPLQPGDRLEVSFELPVFHAALTQPVVVVKLYNHWGATPEGAVQTGGSLTERSASVEGRAVVQLVEVHFQPLSDAGRSAISQFMRAIRQV